MRRSCRSSKLNGVGDERVDEEHRLLDRVLARPDRDQVGVVVLASQLGGRNAPDERGARAVHLVRGHLLAVARSAEDHAERLDTELPGREPRASAALMQKLG